MIEVDKMMPDVEMVESYSPSPISVQDSISDISR